MDEEENGDTSNVVTAEQVPIVSEHDTLKYHLLGPSLTKAGQDSVDQKKV
jgi:DNA polymerase kappa